MALDVARSRSHFPALSSGFIFADNAGGSQINKDAVDRISDYLLNTNVQLGADYSVSVKSTQRVAEGLEDAKKLFNASSPDEIAFSSSSTMNLENLARALDADVQEGDEFILTSEHETNVGPWKKLATRRGAVVKYWRASSTSERNPYSLSLKLSELIPLVTSKTRFVAFTACSNILGSIVPIKEVAKKIRELAKVKGSRKTEICIDCVAYAPHRRMDVVDWDIDYCVFSYYKVYGPHISALYIRSSSLTSSVSSLAHHFLPVESKTYKIEPGGPGYELVYAATSVVPYLLSLTQSHELNSTFDAITEHEQLLLRPLLEYLTHSKQVERGVRVVGEENLGIHRVPTVSFVVVGQQPIKSKDVVAFFDAKGTVGIRYGHFYAYSLVQELSPSIDVADGVVRISLVHYNTEEEVNEIIKILDEILGNAS